MDFIIKLLVFWNWKNNIYDSILVIIDQLIKMIYYEPVKVTIDAPSLAEVIINIVMQYYNLPDSIITNWVLLFISKFWSSLYYFIGIKQKLSSTF